MSATSWPLAVFLGFIFVIPLSMTEAHGQEVIQVPASTPCFLNYSATYQIWENCGADQDWLEWTLQPWEYITGGFFSIVIVSVIILMTYLAFHKVVYPITIGIMFLPISFFAFPAVFLSWAVLMAFIAIGILIWYIYVQQTRTA